MTLAGIDVSEYQGEINWKAVSDSGITFCILKATEGAQSRDPYFGQNWQAARSVGLIRSAYHFFVASKDPIVQANNFLQLTQALWTETDLPPVLDIEKTYFLNASSVLARAKQWLDTVEKALGRKPIIYTFPNFWENTIGNPTALADYPLWIAHYETNNPIVPGGWKTWTMHQYTESGTVPGIEGAVDRNYFNGDTDDLQKLLKAKAPLKIGASGKVVLDLQNRLKSKGFEIGSPDGVFGKKTQACVITFQKSYQLIADGIVGNRTWTVLQSTANPSKPPASTSGIRLADVCLSYRKLAHQDQALQWLQQRLPKPLLDEFTMTWRQVSENTSSEPMNRTPLLLSNVCLSYQGKPHQEQAINRLQQQIDPAILEEFAKRWRR